MYRIIRSLVALALLLCLPLQGLAATADHMLMPPDASVAASMPAMDAGTNDHCMQHAHDAQPKKSDTACDKCFSCHISIAQALMPFMASFELGAAGVAVPAAAAEKPSTLIFPLFRPPISA